MRKFDNKVQVLKYKALREVARDAWDDNLTLTMMDIPRRIVPGKTPTMRCCVYKERAILGERVKAAMGWDQKNPNVIEIIDIACDECPVSGFEINDACRGCLAHHCEDACPRDAIVFDRNQKAHIDKTRCVECGACAKACPYGAIHNHIRPCEAACRVKAITRGEELSAVIDNNRCIACGACAYQCPFGAITDKSYILDAIDLILKSQNNTKFKVVAIVAPAISSQFTYARTGQVVSGIRALGFDSVIEAALGADMVAVEEAGELLEKGVLTSSCCPAFVDYVHKQFPELAKYVSTTLSPMATIGKYLKEQDPTCKTVFIGPCTAKKLEAKKPTVSPYIDVVITFEELQALFDSRDIDITALEDRPLEGASYFGRVFARCGGLAEAVAQSLKERGREDFNLKAISCDGVDACRIALTKLAKGLSDVNFIEGMMCTGGCIGGAGCLTHGQKNKTVVDQYGAEGKATIKEALDGTKK